VLEAALGLHIPHPNHWPDLAELRRRRTPRRLGEQAPDLTITRGQARRGVELAPLRADVSCAIAKMGWHRARRVIGSDGCGGPYQH
jgi:hypothetical protein